MNAPWIHIVLLVVVSGFIAATGQTADLPEEPILEVVFRVAYHNSDPYEIAAQVEDKPQKVTMKMADDFVVAKFEITPVRPCVATISIEAEHIESASPSSWPARCFSRPNGPMEGRSAS